MIRHRKFESDAGHKWLRGVIAEAVDQAQGLAGASQGIATARRDNGARSKRRDEAIIEVLAGQSRASHVAIGGTATRMARVTSIATTKGNAPRKMSPTFRSGSSMAALIV